MGAWWVELTGRTDASYLFRTDIRRRVSPEPLSLTQVQLLYPPRILPAHAHGSGRVPGQQRLQH